jgi:hypothetical protein
MQSRCIKPMKKNLKILLLLTGTVAVASLGSAGVTAWANFSSDRRVVLENTLRTASLQERAKEYGSLTVTFHPKPLRRYDEVETLFRDSATVIVGVVNDSFSQLSTPKQNSIATNYQVSVSSVLKGSIQNGSSVSVLFPGGRLEFDNGTTAEVIRPKYWRVPEVNSSYVFFLKEVKEREGFFELVGGPQGLFKLSSKGHIVPQGRADDLLMQKYYKRSVISFLEEISSLSRNRKRERSEK